MGEQERPDPLIDEVRQRRRSLLERHHGDLKELLRAIQELQARHPEKVMKPQRR